MFEIDYCIKLSNIRSNVKLDKFTTISLRHNVNRIYIYITIEIKRTTLYVLYMCFNKCATIKQKNFVNSFKVNNLFNIINKLIQLKVFSFDILLKLIKSRKTHLKKHQLNRYEKINIIY